MSKLIHKKNAESLEETFLGNAMSDKYMII